MAAAATTSAAVNPTHHLTKDEQHLAELGYKQTLHRTWNTFESFMAAFGGMYFVGGLQIAYSTGIYSGGPAALWSSWIVTVIGTTITAASLAEVCSAIPLSGSIYLWAAAAAGPKYGRLAGFVVGCWTTAAWTSFVASTAQATSNFITSQLVAFNIDFPGGVDYSNIKFRALTFGISQVLLAFTIYTNFLAPRKFKWIFKASLVIMVALYIILFIALPVGASRTYGLRSAKFVFTETFNGTGASTGWNWCLSYLSCAYVITGFDAAAHVAEEVKDPSLSAARGVFWSAAVTGIMGFPLLLLILFCSPPIETLYELGAPQPLVLLFELALGSGGQVFVSVVSIIGLLVNMSVCIVAASRLVSSVARDGILPGSAWIGKVDKNGMPTRAVYFIWMVAAVLLCTILPSNVAFTSLISISGVPTISAYALIPVLRLTFTRGQFTNGKWSTGRWSTPFCVIAAVWNLFICSVMFSPYVWPVTAETFNFSCVLFVFVTIIGVVSWFIVPESKWLSREFVAQARAGIQVGSDDDLTMHEKTLEGTSTAAKMK